MRTFDPAEVWLFGSVAGGYAVTSPVPFDVTFTDPARFEERAAVPGTVERAATFEGRRLHHRKC